MMRDGTCPTCGQCVTTRTVEAGIRRLPHGDKLWNDAVAICRADGSPEGAVLCQLSYRRRLPRHYYETRARVWKMLHDAGVSYPSIGAVWDLDHTTILMGVRIVTVGRENALKKKYGIVKRDAGVPCPPTARTANPH